MSSFPLYASLNKDLLKRDLTIVQKRNFMNNIDKLDANGHELMFALIKAHYLENESNAQFDIPYSGKISGDKIEYDLEQIPIQLKHILYKFLFLHLQRMEEDKKLYTNIL
jgi:hypothetical protein